MLPFDLSLQSVDNPLLCTAWQSDPGWDDLKTIEFLTLPLISPRVIWGRLSQVVARYQAACKGHLFWNFDAGKQARTASEGARTALEDVRPSSLLNRCIVRLTAVGLRSFSNNVIGDGLAWIKLLVIQKFIFAYVAWQVFWGDYQIFGTVIERDKWQKIVLLSSKTSNLKILEQAPSFDSLFVDIEGALQMLSYISSSWENNNIHLQCIYNQMIWFKDCVLSSD